MTSATVEEVDYLEGGGGGPGIPELPREPAARPAAAIGTPAMPAPELPKWEQATIEQFLQGTGAGLHMLAGVAEADWRMTKADLERIAPPLTRIANRYEPLLRIAPIADPLLVAHGTALWGWRSALERQRALRDRELEPLEPGERYVTREEAEAAEEALGADRPAPAARAGRMRSPADTGGAATATQEEELPGTPADWDEPGRFNNGRLSR